MQCSSHLAGVHLGMRVLCGLCEKNSNQRNFIMAAVLSIPAGKTLLRRHLSIHFKDLVGRDVMGEKREAETASGFVPLTPTAKAKQRHQGGQFTLKRKKSKSQFDYGDLVCPYNTDQQQK